MTTQQHASHDHRPHPDRPETWAIFRPLIIAHDVGLSNDRSTAVVGGGSPFQSGVSGILEARELPQGLYGSARASALATVDRRYHNNALIVADLSNEASYGEFLYQTFGRRVIGVQITRHGDGMKGEWRQVGQGAMLVYTIGRTHLFDYFLSLLATDMVHLVKGPESERAYAQLTNLQLEMRDTGKCYSCLPGHHDDLAISCCMLAWACRHPHLPSWITTFAAERMPRYHGPKVPSGAWT